MPWKRFAVFNVLGAALWVTAISFIGFFFGSRWGLLMHFMKRFDLILGAAFVLVVAVLWWRSRRLGGPQART
jgi:membrane protein DedA with SNARE-associated domain